MFAPLLTDYFEKQSDKAAAGIIWDDRVVFVPVITKVKQYLKNKPDIVCSNVNALAKHYNIFKKKHQPETHLIIYATHARKVATDITNIIHKSFGKFTQMRSVLPGEEYVIMCNFRSVVSIYKIDRYRKLQVSELFDTINIGKIAYFPAKVELLTIYRALYRPNQYDEWPTFTENEAMLYNVFQSQKPVVVKRPTVKCHQCKEARAAGVLTLKQTLLEFLSNENYVLVGERALDLQSVSNAPLKIISENDITLDYARLTEFLSKHTKYGIYFKKRRLYVPKNNRIIKHTIYIKYPNLKSGVDKPLISIYNSGSYELIPYTTVIHEKMSIKIGVSHVIMYYLFIDLWVIDIVTNLNKALGNEPPPSDTNTVRALINKARSMPKYTKTYMGVNFNEAVAQKIIISKTQIKKSTYYPEIAIRSKKIYELIATS
jgi:hypothetical protein